MTVRLPYRLWLLVGTIKARTSILFDSIKYAFANMLQKRAMNGEYVPRHMFEATDRYLDALEEDRRIRHEFLDQMDRTDLLPMGSWPSYQLALGALVSHLYDMPVGEEFFDAVEERFAAFGDLVGAVTEVWNSGLRPKADVF